MYYSKIMPFYASCRYPAELENEMRLLEEMEKMKAYYPKRAAKIQEKVDLLMDRLEYDGSFLYDEYPDRFTMKRMCDHLCEEVEKEDGEFQLQSLPPKALRELVEVLFFHEMYHRRCRRGRCHRYF